MTADRPSYLPGDLSPGALRGKLLVATPQLTDPNFARAVVLLLEHNVEGALGVVVNRPSTMPMVEVLAPWQPVIPEPQLIFVGGPVQPDAAIGLGWSADGLPADGLRVLDGRVGIVNLEQPDGVAQQLLAVRVFAGYAGWTAAQLDSEIADGSWYVLDAEPADAFSDEPEALWRKVLRRQPGELAFVSLFPDDPGLN